MRSKYMEKIKKRSPVNIKYELEKISNNEYQLVVIHRLLKLRAETGWEHIHRTMMYSSDIEDLVASVFGDRINGSGAMLEYPNRNTDFDIELYDGEDIEDFMKLLEKKFTKINKIKN